MNGKCSGCDRKVPVQAKFCPNCGRPKSKTAPAAALLHPVKDDTHSWNRTTTGGIIGEPAPDADGTGSIREMPTVV